MTSAGLERFRPWFYGAAVYNALAGASFLLLPGPMTHLAGIGDLRYPALFQCIGMMVMVYAAGYWLVARDPIRYGAFAWLGLAGKTFGPVGFLIAASSGALPWRFGWINLTNDVIWLPAFLAFCLTHLKMARGT